MSIKQTQKNFFKRENGSSPKSGLTFPNFTNLVKSFGIKSFHLNSKDPVKFCSNLKKIMRINKPLFIEVDTYRYYEHCGPNKDDNLNCDQGNKKLYCSTSYLSTPNPNFTRVKIVITDNKKKQLLLINKLLNLNEVK